MLTDRKSGLREVYRSAYFTVELDDAEMIMWVRRTPEPFPSIAVMEEEWPAALGSVERRERGRYGLLVDMREGPSRNDPEFETSAKRLRRLFLVYFRKQAFLVRTAAGALQVRRLSWEEGQPIGDTSGTFMDEGQALAHLREPRR